MVSLHTRIIDLIISYLAHEIEAFLHFQFGLTFILVFKSLYYYTFNFDWNKQHWVSLCFFLAFKVQTQVVGYYQERYDGFSIALNYRKETLEGRRREYIISMNYSNNNNNKF
jgi:hypothetical protein